MASVLLSSAYFAPVQWYQKLYRADRCLIELHDNFVKQTYRNRCVIATTQGVQTLSVPVERWEGQKCPMRDVRISDHGNWRHLHWNALRSAYGESPFFEFLADDIRPFFERRWDFLFEFNMAITEKICELIDIPFTAEPTSEYVKDADQIAASTEAAINGLETSGDGALSSNNGEDHWTDWRDAIRPKHPLPDADFEPRRYYQVYEQKHGFLPNLSILDLLFNMGRESVLYL